MEGRLYTEILERKGAKINFVGMLFLRLKLALLAITVGEVKLLFQISSKITWTMGLFGRSLSSAQVRP